MCIRKAVQITQAIVLALLLAVLVLIVPHVYDCHMGGCETDAECERLCGGTY